MQLYANPYTPDAGGFYFESMEEFEKLAAANRTEFGQVVEEYEFEFIEGSEFERRVAVALHDGQFPMAEAFEIIDRFGEENHAAAILAALGTDGIGVAWDLSYLEDNFNWVVLHDGGLRDYAIEVLTEQLRYLGGEHLENYLDFDAYERMLNTSGDVYEIYSEGYAYVLLNAGDL
jgi:antirestriction protein